MANAMSLRRWGHYAGPRERLDTTFVINCNLQRLTARRGNGKIIQELEAAFARGLERHQGDLVQRLGPAAGPGRGGLAGPADGRWWTASTRNTPWSRSATSASTFSAVIRNCGKWLSSCPTTTFSGCTAAGTTREGLRGLQGGPDHKGAPTVILAKTIKGHGLGEAGEGRNITHQQKKLNEEELFEFRNRFGIPVSDDEVARPFYAAGRQPGDEISARTRKELGGFPRPQGGLPAAATPGVELFQIPRRHRGSPGLDHDGFARLVFAVAREPIGGKLIVPIIPDEARTSEWSPLPPGVTYSHGAAL